MWSLSKLIYVKVKKPPSTVGKPPSIPPTTHTPGRHRGAGALQRYRILNYVVGFFLTGFRSNNTRQNSGSPVWDLGTTVDQWSRNSSQKTQLYVYVQWRTNYMFRLFPNWPSSGCNTMSEELYTYYKYRHQY